MVSWARYLESRAFVAAVTAVVVFAGVAAARRLGLLEAIELGLYDRYLRWAPEPVSAGERVIVVTYTEDDIQEVQDFPLRDVLLTGVLATVLDQQPRAVGVDFYRDIMIPPGSEALEALLQRDPRVIMIYRFGDEEFVPIAPPKVLRGTEQVGFADLLLDRDDVVRRALLYQDDEGQGTGLSLALRVSLLYLAQEGVGLGIDPNDPSQLRLGPTTIPRLSGTDGGYARVDDAGYQTFIRFEGSRPFRSVRVGDVLRRAFGPDDFRDKMVFVGVAAETHSDLISTPFGQWPGVFVHGHIASQLVRFGLGEGSPQATLSEKAEAGWILLWAALGAAWGLSRSSVWVFIPIAAAGVAALGTVGYAALLQGWWIPNAAPALAWLGSASVVTAYLSRREAAERADLMQLFSRHISRDVVDDLWEHRGEFLHGGRPRAQQLMATAMFLDVAGFTSIAEKLDAIEMMGWLNDFLGTMADEAARHGGIVDDYFGDGVKIDFGVPIPHRSEEEIDADAVAAVRCALAMGEAIQRLNEGWRQAGLPTAGMRIGIATGRAIAGSIGSADRLKYTIVGDIVNVAARLERLDYSQHDFARRPWRVLIAEETRSRLGDRFETRDLGWRAVKGKVEKIHVHEVLGQADAKVGTSVKEA